MTENYRKLPFDLFIRTIKHNHNSIHTILLGAGASVDSKAPSAEDLIQRWKRDIYISKNISGIKGIVTIDEVNQWLISQGGYPAIGDPSEYMVYADKAYVSCETRRRDLEDMLHNLNPSPGYHYLCLLIKTGLIKIVLTTNFDDLVNKAAYINGITPKPINIETKAWVSSSIPHDMFLSIALHGDYKYEKMMNTEKELDNQVDEFKKIMKYQLYEKHLIVIGYSGRDKSLMDSLCDAYMDGGIGEIFWCTYKNHCSNTVKDFLNKVTSFGRKAYLIETDGFDDTIKKIAGFYFFDNPKYQDLMLKINPVVGVHV